MSENKKTAVIGFPVDHSVSPTIHNHWISENQIDAEGYDLEVIKIFEIEKTQPEAIIFENVNLPEDELKACLQLLKNNNYLLKKFGRDTLALHSSNTEMAHLVLSSN